MANYSKGTVGEQLLYEILDPANYMLPDVNVDFTQITLEELAPRNGTGRVLVKGARGKPAPSSYKASITVVEGWRVRQAKMSRCNISSNFLCCIPDRRDVDDRWPGC
jgi:hypothetical protein